MKQNIRIKNTGALWALKRMCHDLYSIRLWLLAIVVCAVGVIACNIISPKLLGSLIGAISDYSLSKSDTEAFLHSLTTPILLLLVTYALYALFSWGKAFFIGFKFRRSSAEDLKKI